MSNLITKEFVGEQLDFWGKLGAEEQRTVLTETVGVVAEINRGVAAKIAVGRHLQAVKKVLASPREGEGQWLKYCNNLLPFSYRTAERYIEAFERVEGVLPAPVLEAAIARGVDLLASNADPKRPFGAYTEAVKQLPPPKDPTPKQAVEWVERVQEVAKNTPRLRHNARRRVGARELEVRAFQEFWRAYNGLPAGKTRAAWAVRLIAKLMTVAGLPAQRVEPEAIPDGYRPEPVGRPKKAVQS